MPTVIGKKYSYFDTPDGQDPDKKAWYVTQWAAYAALAQGTVTWAFRPDVLSRTGTLINYGKHFGKWVGMGLAFVSGTFIATDMRKKDDPWNHAFGAFCANGVRAAALGSPTGFILWPFVFYHSKRMVQHDFNPWRLVGEGDILIKRERFHFLNEFRMGKRQSIKERYDIENEAFWKKKRDEDSSV